MHGTVSSRPIAPTPHQRLFERACPGPVDRPHRARLYLLSFWIQNYWGRWAHSRKCFSDLRLNGKVRCQADATWDTTVANGLNEVLCRKLDYKLPEVFSKTPVLVFFLLWLLAGLGLGPTWEDEPPPLRSRVITPQRQNIKTYLGGEAPFHHVDRPDEAKEKRLVKLAKGGDIVARNTLVAGHLWVIKEIAREFRVHDSDIDDLRQEAALALFKALDDFDPRSGNRFSTFAWISVREDMKDWLRKMRKQKRHVSTELIAERNEAALGPYASVSVKPSAEQKIFRGLFEKR